MTRSEFRIKVLRLCDQQQAPYLESESDINDQLMASIKKAVRLSRCLLSSDIVFTTVNAQRTYSFTDESSTFVVSGKQVALLEPLTVYWDGGDGLTAIKNLTGRPGMTPVAEIERYYPDWKNTSTYPAGDPVCAYFEAPATLGIFPAPDGAYSWRIRGFYQHPLLTADDSELLFPEEIEDDVARLCAADLMLPNATSDSRQSIQDYYALAQSALQSYAADMMSQQASRAVRGSKGSRSVDLTQQV